MFEPEKAGSRIVWGSAKSRSQPTFGQTSMLRAGTPQYFEYMTLWSTTVKFVLNPRLWTAELTSSASFCRGVAG
jgi:hypothetical protein